MGAPAPPDKGTSAVAGIYPSLFPFPELKLACFMPSHEQTRCSKESNMPSMAYVCLHNSNNTTSLSLPMPCTTQRAGPFHCTMGNTPGL